MAERKCPTSTAQSYASITNTQPWEPGALTRTPWSGLAALLGAVVCACLTVAVLAVSDGQAVTDWSNQPTVYLAILSALANALLRFAFSKGATIAWWTESFHGGTVESLHQNWRYGDSIWAVISPTRHFHSLRVAAFVIAFVAIDCPLLQRASSVTTAQHQYTVSLRLPIRTGPMLNDTINDDYFYTAEFSGVVQAYTNRSELIVPPNVCQGTCETTVAAAGFNATCTANRTATVDVPGSGTRNEFSSSTQNEVHFRVHIVGSLDKIAATTSFRDQPDRKTVAVRHCEFRPVIVYHNISVTNGTLSLLSSLVSEPILDPYDGEVLSQFFKVPLAGFGLALSDQYQGSALLSTTSDGIQVFHLHGPISRRYISKGSTGHGSANNIFLDPMPDIIATLNDLSLRYAMTDVPMMDPHVWQYSQAKMENQLAKWLKAYPNETLAVLPRPYQTVQAKQIATVLVYFSRYSYLAAALAVMLLTTTSIIPTFYGWWHLGRPRTLSPIEIAKAFDAKLLKDAGSNATAEEIVTLLGSRRVQYGVSKGQELVDMPPRVDITIPNTALAMNEAAEEEHDGTVSSREAEDNAFIEGDSTSIEGDGTPTERDSAQVKHWSVCREDASLEYVEM